jgi:hypothetical protein
MRKARKIYQLVDKDSNYRSYIVYNGEPIEFVCKERTKAIVYTYDEAKKVAKYFIEEKNIPVMIEFRTAYTKQQI